MTNTCIFSVKRYFKWSAIHFRECKYRDCVKPHTHSATQFLVNSRKSVLLALWWMDSVYVVCTHYKYECFVQAPATKMLCPRTVTKTARKLLVRHLIDISYANTFIIQYFILFCVINLILIQKQAHPVIRINYLSLQIRIAHHLWYS